MWDRPNGLAVLAETDSRGQRHMVPLSCGRAASSAVGPEPSHHLAKCWAYFSVQRCPVSIVIRPVGWLWRGGGAGELLHWGWCNLPKTAVWQMITKVLRYDWWIKHSVYYILCQIYIINKQNVYLVQARPGKDTPQHTRTFYYYMSWQLCRLWIWTRIVRHRG